MRWVERFQDEGDIKRHNRNSISYKVTGHQIKFIIFAISWKGVLGWKLYDKGGIDTDRLLEFLEEILGRRKGKLVILDNASCHRNEKVKEYINLNNNLLYSIPYQHYTNAIENFFSILKSKLYKLNGYKYDDLKTNISKAIKEINITSYKNILRGAYQRENYVKKSRKLISRKLKIYKE